MKKLLVAACLSLPLTTGIAEAADLPQYRPAPREIWSWTGLYLGAHIGAGWGQSDFSNGTPVIYGNDVRTPMVQGGGQFGYNWQATDSQFVVGIEAEVAALGADGTNTCFASSGFFISSNCRVKQEATGSLTGRVGYAAGTGGHTLLYAKGGGAWLREEISIANIVTAPAATTMRSDRFGWTVGAGIEQAIAPAWSMKLEYDYADFGRADVAVPGSALQMLPPFALSYMPTSGGVASVSQTMQTIKLGLNMKIGADTGARWGAIPANPLGLPVKALRASMPMGTEVEVGGRVWYSFGRFQKDLGAFPNPAMQDPLVSRLTYQSQSASGEVFGRIDTASSVFIKGFIGGGGLSHGSMNDEDWAIDRGATPYSNTLSDPVTGSIGYATADLGYDIIRDRGGKFGAFIGYNYFREDKTAKGCEQIANPYAGCSVAIPNTTAALTEDDRWQSLRVGINGVVALTDRLQLTADGAYLPFVQFRGRDNHLLRVGETATVSPEFGTGQGVQLEAILSYRITPSFSVGAGGRYWAMWATGADAHTEAFSNPCPCKALPVRTERFGGFLQASYTFDSFH